MVLNLIDSIQMKFYQEKTRNNYIFTAFFI